MATSTIVPLSEYLRTSYEPDCEWVDGELKERGMPDGYHALFQVFFTSYFDRRKDQLRLRALAELRIQVAANRFRIPDVMVIPLDARFLPMPVEPPVLCIEILSPDDRASDLQVKIEDYVAMGVGAIWIVDPRRRAMAVADASGSYNVEEFALPGTGVRISKAELFAELNLLEGK